MQTHNLMTYFIAKIGNGKQFKIARVVKFSTCLE